MHSHSDKQTNHIMATVRDAQGKEREGEKLILTKERRKPEW